MKKLFALFVAVVMLVSGVSASSFDLSAVTSARNYSSDAQVSMTFDTADEFVSCLKQLIGEDAFGDELQTLDLASFLRSLMSFGATAVMQCDMSEDYSQIKMSMTADYDYNVDVNPNLSIGADMKMGMWLDVDLSDVANPKFMMIMMSPMSTKYTYMDIFEGMDDNTKLMTTAMLKMFLNKEFVDSVMQEVMEIYEQNATVSEDGKTYTVKLDNKAFLEYLDKVFELVYERFVALVPMAQEEQVQMNVNFSELGINILGEGGYVIEYKEDGTVSEYCDIEINLGDIYEMIVGQELALENEFVLGFTVAGTANMYDLEKTKVVFPELTEDNSINLAQMMQPEGDNYYQDGDYYYEEYESSYPYFYADIYTDYIPTVEGKVYVPLRDALESAYDDSVNITFEKGVITLTSEYFTDLEKVTFSVGGTKANVDGYDFEIGEIILENGVTYVSSDFFEIIFGWTLEWASYDMLWENYNISFYTQPIDEYYDDF